MAQFWVPGPAHVYAGVGDARALVYLGNSENGVRVTLDWPSEDIHTDWSGTQIPADVLTFAEQAFIRADLNFFDQTRVQTLLLNRYNPLAADGAGPINFSGTLLATEGFLHRVLILCPYGAGTGGKPAYAAHPRGYNFLACQLLQPLEFNLGARPKVYSLVWRALPVYTFSACSIGYVLYNNSVLGLPDPPCD